MGNLTLFFETPNPKAKEDEIRDWLGPAGNIKGLRLNRDKATTKALGYGHVQCLGLGISFAE